MEMENLRLAETDPAKKGNSLFAEVEDQRQAMEKQLLSYKTNYNVLKKQWDLKTQQISKMKVCIIGIDYQVLCPFLNFFYSVDYISLVCILSISK